MPSAGLGSHPLPRPSSLLNRSSGRTPADECSTSRPPPLPIPVPLFCSPPSVPPAPPCDASPPDLPLLRRLLARPPRSSSAPVPHPVGSPRRLLSSHTCPFVGTEDDLLPYCPNPVRLPGRRLIRGQSALPIHNARQRQDDEVEARARARGTPSARRSPRSKTFVRRRHDARICEGQRGDGVLRRLAVSRRPRAEAEGAWGLLAQAQTKAHMRAPPSPAASPWPASALILQP
jgi:hypothetical protein